MTVADSEANLAVYDKQSGGPNGASGYPMLRLLALVSCGTRSVIDAVFGPVRDGETTYAVRLLGSLRAGMILLADRNFAAGFLAAQVAGTGAEFLVRVRTGRTRPEAPGPAPLPGRIVAVALRRRPGPGHRRRDHHRDQRRARHGRVPADHHPGWTRSATRPANWRRFTTSAGRSRPLTLSSSRPSWAAGSCAPAPPTASSKRYTPSWSPTRPCAPRSRTPPPPSRAPTRTGPASPSPSTQPATRSSWPRASPPAPPSIWPARSDGSSWPT